MELLDERYERFNSIFSDIYYVFIYITKKGKCVNKDDEYGAKKKYFANHWTTYNGRLCTIFGIYSLKDYVLYRSVFKISHMVSVLCYAYTYV